MRAKAVLILFVVLVLALVTAAPVAAASEVCCPCWHWVARGETLFSIGRRYNVSPYAIASANGLANPNCIYVGQHLYVPAGPSYYRPAYTPGCPGGYGWYYTVRHGDTLLGIARAHGVNAWSIARANGIYNMNHIWAGQRLLIPGY
jgi:LysM repeat protein